TRAPRPRTTGLYRVQSNPPAGVACPNAKAGLESQAVPAEICACLALSGLANGRLVYRREPGLLDRPRVSVVLRPRSRGVMALPALVLRILSERWPRLGADRISLFVLIFCGLAIVLLQLPRLDLWAQLLLAAGLAWQTGVVANAHPRAFQALVRGTIGWSVR